MASPRALGRGTLGRGLARVLIAALVLALFPVEASAMPEDKGSERIRQYR